MKILIFAITLIIAMWMGVIFSEEPGYLLVAYGRWSLEMPLLLAIIIWSLVLFIVTYLQSIWHGIINLNNNFKNKRKLSYYKKYQNQTQKGILASISNNWQMLEKHAVKAAKNSNASASQTHYLSAAKAAIQQGNVDNTNKYLEKASQLNNDSFALDFTKARLYINNKDYEKALIILKKLNNINSDHKEVLKSLADVYINLKIWDKLVDLLGAFRAVKPLPIDEFLELEKLAFSRWLVNLKEDDFWRKWRVLPRDSQCRYEMAVLAAKYLKNSNIEAAIKIIERALIYAWSEKLIILYGLFVKQARKQLEFAEKFLKKHQDSSLLFLTLGRLCLYQKLWGKAKDYFRISINLEPNLAAYAELARLQDALGDKEQANFNFRNGLLVIEDELAQNIDWPN